MAVTQRSAGRLTVVAAVPARPRPPLAGKAVTRMLTCARDHAVSLDGAATAYYIVLHVLVNLESTIETALKLGWLGT